uniref:Uncharacterized protein n=1 Tax=Cucumis melo TaxID=3656 RepID=A0A9I9ECV3_CUCME
MFPLRPAFRPSKFSLSLAKPLFEVPELLASIQATFLYSSHALEPPSFFPLVVFLQASQAILALFQANSEVDSISTIEYQVTDENQQFIVNLQHSSSANT